MSSRTAAYGVGGSILLSALTVFVCCSGQAQQLSKAGRMQPEPDAVLQQQADVVAPPERAAPRPIWQAVFHGEYERAKLLLEAGAEPNVLGTQWRTTPLHLAARRCDERMVSLLIDHGAGLQVENADGIAALGAAILCGCDEVVRLLAARGAHLSPSSSLPDICARGALKDAEEMLSSRVPLEARAEGGLTGLHCAVGGGWLDVAEMLLSRGADVNARTDGGATPLHVAAMGGNVRMIDLLTAAGADVGLANDSGFTPLMSAAVRGRHAAIQALAHAGARPGGRSALHGDGPLHLAVLSGAGVRTVQALLATGADPNGQNDLGRTPLHAAAARADSASAKLLARAGGRAVADKGGTTPLMVAAFSNADTAILSALFAAGDAIDATNDTAETALHHAAALGHYRQVSWLVAHGADVLVMDANGSTPLDRARANGHSQIAELLTRSTGVGGPRN